MVLGKIFSVVLGAQGLNVSILVLMDGAREGQLILFVAEGDTVSILVLMDGAREAGAFFVPVQKFVRFNPCFDGWCSGRLIHVRNVMGVLKFQSLF